MSRRLFICDQEIDFFNGIDKELIQEIVGQEITYYAVSDELTHSDDLYGEAMRKTVYTPVVISARVLYNDPQQSITGFSVDTTYSIEIYFHIYELTERGITPREGDFVKFGNNAYEIQKLTSPQIVYGQIEHKVQVKAICKIAREGQFNIDGE